MKAPNDAIVHAIRRSRSVAADLCWTPGRLLSLAVALAYIAIGLGAEGGAGALRMCGLAIVVLACIWFGDAMGRFASVVRITKATPGDVVAVCGWGLLFLPIVLAVLR